MHRRLENLFSLWLGSVVDTGTLQQAYSKSISPEDLAMSAT